MQIQKVGDILPDPRYYAQEGARIRFYESGFEFIACVKGIKEAEKQSFASGPLIEAFYTVTEIPFFVVKTTEMSFDAPFNFLKINDDWEQRMFNLIQITLVEQTTGKIMAMRFTSFPASDIEALLAVAKRQRLKYRSAAAVDNQIILILLQLTTEQMLRLAQHTQRF